MKLYFYKYQGTGNDFVMIDNRAQSFPKETKLIKHLCDRRFGVGADGLILLENHSGYDFKMVYYNSDGNESSMCGNGGRCLVAFAKFLGIIESKTTFIAMDGVHYASIEGDKVHLQMQNVSDISVKSNYYFLNTGSPHHVEIRENVGAIDLKREGAQIRYDIYGNEGSNVNFVEPIKSNHFKVRTYERGVEDETYSCGTGATAVALAMHHQGKTEEKSVVLHTEGGLLEVSFEPVENGYKEVWLSGATQRVFEGHIEC